MKTLFSTVILLASLLGTPFLTAQNTTTITGTVIDSDAQPWANASWTAQMVNPGGSPPVYIGGGAAPTRFTGVLDSDGTFDSASVGNNSQIVPFGTTWRFTVCSQTSAACQTLNPSQTVSGSTMDVGTWISSEITAPRIDAAAIVYAYNDTEIQNSDQGDGYTNTVSGGQFVWGGSAYVAVGGSGSPCATCVYTPTPFDFDTVFLGTVMGSNETIELNMAFQNTCFYSVPTCIGSKDGSVLGMAGFHMYDSQIDDTPIGVSTPDEVHTKLLSVEPVTNTGNSESNTQQFVAGYNDGTGQRTESFTSFVSVDSGTNPDFTVIYNSTKNSTGYHGHVFKDPVAIDGITGTSPVCGNGAHGELTTSGCASGSSAVSSVFTRTGAVVAASGDYNVSQVTGAAPLASPAFTGTPTGTTASPGDNTTKLASTAFVTTAVAAVPAAPVTSVFSRTGVVVAASGDYTAAQVTNAASTATTNTFSGQQTFNETGATTTCTGAPIEVTATPAPSKPFCLFVNTGDGSVNVSTTGSAGPFKINMGAVANTYGSTTNCASAASPAVCGSASSGAFVIAAAATTVVVNTTSVTANSEISIQPDSSLGTRLSVTCNTLISSVINPVVTARVAATSFTVTIPGAGLVTNPACYSYSIMN